MRACEDAGRPASRQRRHVWILFLFLLFSVPSYTLIPFFSFWGLDLQNLYLFQNSPLTQDQPYLVSGAVVNDAGSRPMNYPPLLYWSFVWLRALSFEAAIRVWALVSVVMMLAVLPAWLHSQRVWDDRRALMLWVLLLAQFPMIFALERGNNDVLVVVLWSAAYFVFRLQLPFWSGAAAGTAAVLKLYPGVACLVVGLGLCVARPKVGAKFIAGMALAIAAAVLVWFEQTTIYVTRVLPEFAQVAPPQELFSHALRSCFRVTRGSPPSCERC